MKTKNLSKSVIRDACHVALSIYKMNATTAIGYAFTKRQDGRGVNTGEFIFRGEVQLIDSNSFDGFINFQEKTLTDLISNQSITI